MRETIYYAGLDLGKAQDYTAFVMLEKYLDTDAFKQKTSYGVSWCERFPLGTPYTKIVDEMLLKMRNPVLTVKGRLIIDASGVGEPVREMFVKERKLHIPVAGIYITGGSTVRDRNETLCYNVPRQDLISATKILFDSQSIEISDELELAPVLIDELHHLDEGRSPGRSEDEILWREKPNDDLAFALMVAVWWAARDPIGRHRVFAALHDDEEYTNSYNPFGS